MENRPRLTIDDLRRMCDEREEESLTLEFKQCAAIKPVPEKLRATLKGAHTKTELVRELSKDVSAMLNSAGGHIVYGIREEEARAASLDSDNAFSSQGEEYDNVRPERVVQWLRSHISPPPAVDVYPVQADGDESWFLVIEIPQGEQAYQATDKRFYKRIANIAQPMEQYEVVDVMNRTTGAALEARLALKSTTRQSNRIDVRLELSITSRNNVASEKGEAELRISGPFEVPDNPYDMSPAHRRGSDSLIRLPTGEQTLVGCSWYRYRWGGFGLGEVIFPGDWRTVTVLLRYPSRVVESKATSLLAVRLFTVNRSVREEYYALLWEPESPEPTLVAWHLLSPDEQRLILSGISGSSESSTDAVS